MSETHLTDTAYSSFSLPANLMQGIEDAGFSRCTPIQAETLPLALDGGDVAGQDGVQEPVRTVTVPEDRTESETTDGAPADRQLADDRGRGLSLLLPRVFFLPDDTLLRDYRKAVGALVWLH